MDKPNIAELAVAAWRLERWLENLNAERKLAAKKSLREIKNYLEASGIEIVDPLGWKFDEGLPLLIVNNEADDEDDIIIVQTTAPIVKENGAVIQAGKVILGKNIKEQKANSEIKTEIKRPNAGVEQSQGTVPNQSEAVLEQSKLVVSENDVYWIRCFNLKGEKEGYQAAIEIATNFDVDLFLMDEQVYTDYIERGITRTWFQYRPKAGCKYIVPPYPDLWYAIAYPPKGHFCHEFSFDMNCIWLPKRTEESLMPYYDQTAMQVDSNEQSVISPNNENADTEHVSVDEEHAPDNEAVATDAEEKEKEKESPTGVDADRWKKIKLFGKF